MPGNARDCPFWIEKADKKYIRDILAEQGIDGKGPLVIIAPGARSGIKRWPAEGFVSVAEALAGEYHVKIVLAGDENDSFAITAQSTNNWQVNLSSGNVGPLVVNGTNSFFANITPSVLILSFRGNGKGGVASGVREDMILFLKSKKWQCFTYSLPHHFFRMSSRYTDGNSWR